MLANFYTEKYISQKICFHIELAYFNAIGKYINESGGPFILTESGVLAPGSLNGFIKGKQYNRCKRLHTLLVAALEILRIEEFLGSDGDNTIALISAKEEINKKNEKPFLIENLSGNLNAKETSEGAYGCTAQNWIGYIQLVMNWFNLSRSIREGDLDLYIFSLKKYQNISSHSISQTMRDS